MTSGGTGGMVGAPCVPAEANCGPGLKCAPLLGEDGAQGLMPNLSEGRCAMAPMLPISPFKQCAAPVADDVGGVTVLVDACVPGSFCLHGLEKTPLGAPFQGSCRPICSQTEPASPCPTNPINGPVEGAISPPPEGTNSQCFTLSGEPYGLCYPWCNPLREQLAMTGTCATGVTPLDGCFALSVADQNDPGIIAAACFPWVDSLNEGGDCVSAGECGSPLMCIEGKCRRACELGNQGLCVANQDCQPLPLSGLFLDPPGSAWLSGVGYCM